MCSNCGFPTSIGHWTEAGATAGHDRIRARFRRAALLKRVLTPYGLTVHDDGATPGVTLSTLTGASEIVENLGDLWIAVERLAGRPLDPLDPRFTGS